MASIATPSGGQAVQPQRLPSLTEFRQYADLIYREVSTGERWSSLSGKYVQLHYVKSDSLGEAEAQKIATLFDLCTEADCKTLSMELPLEGVPVFLYPTATELKFAVGVDQNLSAGMSLGDWAAIVMPRGGDPNQLEASCAHEVGLALIHKEIGLYSCALFSEGIAFYLQGSLRHAQWVSHPAPIEKTSLLALSENARTADDYLQGARFLSFLVQQDHGDPKRLKELMSRLNQERIDQIRNVGNGSWAVRVSRSFQSVYGSSLAELDRKWRAYFSGKTQQTGSA